jgi:hypothetical protein
MSSWLVWTTTWIAVASSGMALAAGHTLSTDSQTMYVIVTPEQPRAEELTAAEWLANALRDVTGAEFAIKSEGAGDLPASQLLVGNTQAARDAGIDPLRMQSEEWQIRSVGPALVLAGGRPRGTIYAVCEFLEQHVGVLRLDPFTAVIPARPSLDVAPLDRRGRPAFLWRQMFTGFPYGYPAGGGPLIEQFVIGNKNNINGRTSSGDYARSVPDGVHTFGRFISSKEFAASHPEYFGMDAEGKRVTDDLGSPSMWTQVCATNPDVRRISVERGRQFLLEERAAAQREGREPTTVLTLSQNDNTVNLCRCPDCSALSDREGSESGLLLDYVNFVARGLKDEFPDLLVQTEAYNFTLTAPKALRPEPNAAVRFCDNYGFSDLTHPLASPRNERPMKLFDGWREKQCVLGVWDYWRVFQQHPAGMFAPSSNLRALREDLRMFRAAGVQLMTVEAEDLFGAGINADPTSADMASFMPLRIWVGMKLLDDPDKDLDQLVDTFCRGYYGHAARPMRALLEQIEDRQMRLSTRVVDVPRHVWLQQFCDAAFFDSALQLLDEAMQATAITPVEQTHVRRERIVFDSALLWIDRHVRDSSPDMAARWPDRAAILQRHRADWNAYIETVFNADGLNLARPIIEQGISLAEKLHRDETAYFKTAIATKESAVRLDGHLDEPHWQRAVVSRMLPRDPAAEHDDPSAVRFAWTTEALYVAVEQPVSQTTYSFGVTLSDADRKQLQLSLYVTQGDGPRSLSPYFYGFDDGGSLKRLPGRPIESACVGSVGEAKTITELRFCWSDIVSGEPSANKGPPTSALVVNVEAYPNAESKAPTHTSSPWLIGTQPNWHSGYYSALKLARQTDAE